LPQFPFPFSFSDKFYPKSSLPFLFPLAVFPLRGCSEGLRAELSLFSLPWLLSSYREVAYCVLWGLLFTVFYHLSGFPSPRLALRAVDSSAENSLGLFVS